MSRVTQSGVREHKFFQAVDIYMVDEDFVIESWHAFAGYGFFTRCALVVYVRLCWLAGSVFEGYDL